MPLPQRLEICAELRDRVALDLIGPLGIDRLNIWRDGQSQIEGQIGHIERPPIETERRACREQQPLRDAVLVDAVEIAELARTLPVWSIVLPLNMANLRRGSPVRVELGSRTLGARRSAPGAKQSRSLRVAFDRICRDSGRSETGALMIWRSLTDPRARSSFWCCSQHKAQCQAGASSNRSVEPLSRLR